MKAEDLSSTSLSRRSFLMAAALVALPASGIEEVLARSARGIERREREGVLGYIESLARTDGGYGWADTHPSHLTSTFAALGVYQLLGERVPRRESNVRFVRESYPLPRNRRWDRPMRHFDFQQMQSLIWLVDDVGSFEPMVAEWTRPSEYTTRYELGGNPVLQQEAAALRCRALVDLAPDPTGDWARYFQARRRANGTFNNTPAVDGSDGHVMNTRWGLQSWRLLGLPTYDPEPLVGWVRACQQEDGGFTWMPEPSLAPVSDVTYSWAALSVLRLLDSAPARPEDVVRFLHALRNTDGGYGDRAGWPSNAVATYRAVASLALLDEEPAMPSPRKPRTEGTLAGLNAYSVQIQAPGVGSPAEAVYLAKTLRIDLWGAKNATPGWIERAQELADAGGVPVRFFIADEEYGTYFGLPGLGTYSHLSDIIAPVGSEIGASLADSERGHSWTTFRRQRIDPLRDGQGRLVWQFNENEEFTRLLLDDAIETGGYAAISTFHFGDGTFLDRQPFLRSYDHQIPYIALLDAHTSEPWWFGDQLYGMRTVFFAREPTWEAFLDALQQNRTISVRHDWATRYETHYAGGSAALREALRRQEHRWRWWGSDARDIRRPVAAVTILRPGDPFEKAVPEQGITIRVRCWWDNATHGTPEWERARLERLELDGGSVDMQYVEERNESGTLEDCYHLYNASALAAGTHNVRAYVLTVGEGELHTLDEEFEIT